MSRLVAAAFVVALFFTLSLACTSTPQPSPVDEARFDELVPRWIDEYDVAGVGVGVIEDGELVWTGFWGEQAPGVPAGPDTVWNTASVAKTMTAETLLALDARGEIDLDEPIAPYVDHPDLESDPRYEMLTPRLLMSHRAGLLNWPHSYDDGRLAFDHDPATRFSYSGAGVRLAARYAEAKTGRDFEELAREQVLEPLGIEEMSLGRMRPWLQGRHAQPMGEDGEWGSLEEHWGRLVGEQPGDWSAADDLLTTIDAYGRFLAGVVTDGALAGDPAERTAILTSLEGTGYGCTEGEDLQCPERYGHGIGWMVYDMGDHTVLKHGGNDSGESALAWISPETGDGAVVMVNGGNGILVTVRLLDLLNQEPEIAAYYRHLVGKHYGIEMEALH
jgi:CubicO group peptidase (beta-lactamase class C family)